MFELVLTYKKEKFVYEQSVFRYRSICVHIFEKLNFQKRGAERGAATMRAALASEGEINSKNWYKKRYRHP